MQTAFPTIMPNAPFTHLDEMPDFVRADVEAYFVISLDLLRHHERLERCEERMAARRPMLEWVTGRKPIPDKSYLFERATAYRDSYCDASEAPTAHEIMEEVLLLFTRFSR